MTFYTVMLSITRKLIMLGVVMNVVMLNVVAPLLTSSILSLVAFLYIVVHRQFVAWMKSCST